MGRKRISANIRISTAEIEHSALTIEEILSNDYAPLPEAERNKGLAEERLQRWLEVSAEGDKLAFAQRLARHQWDMPWLLARLAGVHRRDGIPEPAWVGRTHQLIDVLMHGTPNARHHQIAFGPLLSPVIDAAEQRMLQSLPFDALRILTPEALENVVTHLRLRLANLCELPLYQALLQWRKHLLGAARDGDLSAKARLQEDSLDAFAMHMKDGGYVSLFRDKPILFRLMAMLVEQWESSYRAFLIRLANDQQALGQLLASPTDHERRVSRVNWGLSDPHNEGLSVLGVELEGGYKALYKPKDLRPDQFVIALVTRLQKLGLEEALVLPQVLVRDGYGWTTHIQQAPCETASEVSDYYRRFGTWLALFHVLSTSDMHMENFIASGSHPVPVDFEMILQGIRQRPRAVDDLTEAHWLASHMLEKSVQSVGMLPAYVQGQEGDLISMGALEPSVYPVKVLNWEAINTPRMLLSSATERIEVNSNLPTFNGQALSVASYKYDFLQGFDEALRFVASHPQAILGFITATDTSTFTVRRVIRPTRFYYMLLKRLYDHRHMEDSVRWSLEADFVARFYDWDDHAERPWKLAASERRQLLDLGIPHFVMTPDSNIIHDGRAPVTRLHLLLGPEVVRTRLAELRKEEIGHQSNIVRVCLQLPAPPLLVDEGISLGMPFIQAIGDRLMRTSIRAERSIAWIGLTRVDHDVAAQLAPLGHDLYYGATGIAVFLAALSRAGSPSSLEDCRRALGATLQTVQSSRLGQLQRAIGIGGAVGLGSIVYGLALVGELLSDGQMFEAAKACAQGIVPEAIEQDTKFDLVAGAAGACLALLALHKRSPAEWLVERAILCGDHLLKNRDPSSGMWCSTVFCEALTGVAHGAAGFALAFSRLYGVTGQIRFSQAAQDCIAFENSHYDDAAGNWKDTRSAKLGGAKRAPNQWCYGAVGIGISRLAMLEDGAVSCDVLDSDVDRALVATLADKGGRHSGLCCGDAGHIEFLVNVATKRDRRDLMNMAQQRAVTLSDTWSRTGDLIWNGGQSSSNPGLFQGLAGAGFSGLRSLGVDVPSPLAWS